MVATTSPPFNIVPFVRYVTSPNMLSLVRQFLFSRIIYARFVTPHAPTDLNWYPNLRTSHHLIADLTNLNARADDYQVLEEIRVGNNSSLSIKNIGTTPISTLIHSFLLNNILYMNVPDITKNQYMFINLPMILILSWNFTHLVFM